jgi:hypothetical protein
MHRLDCPCGIDFIDVRIAPINVSELNNVVNDSKHSRGNKEATENEPCASGPPTLNVRTASHNLKIDRETYIVNQRDKCETTTCKENVKRHKKVSPKKALFDNIIIK